LDSKSALDKFNERMIKLHGITPEQLRINRERARFFARCNETTALRHAREQGEESERKIWQGVVAEKDAAIADKDAVIANKDAEIANQAAENEWLRAQIAQLQAKAGG